MKIALTGKLRSGKDTVANYLETEYGFVPFAFGDKLKEEFHTAYPHVSKNPKPRKGYQLYGQLMRYVYGETMWEDLCFSNIGLYGHMAKGYNSVIPFNPVITDARQPSDFDRVRKEGYVLIKVVCDKNVRLQRAIAAGDHFDLNDLYHETEAHIDTVDADFTIINDGAIEQLYENVDWIVERLKEMGN